MTWDETANICTAKSKDALFRTALEAAAENDVSSQPLTRPECDRAGMAWNDDANVCGSGSERAVTSSQPLTRTECDNAGMRWSDDANVCAEKSGANQAPEATTPGQPLTRADCDKAGMTWKDNANVCSRSQKLPTLRAHHLDRVLQPTSLYLPSSSTLTKPDRG